jgi:hypothetical protein
MYQLQLFEYPITAVNNYTISYLPDLPSFVDWIKDATICIDYHSFDFRLLCAIVAWLSGFLELIEFQRRGSFSLYIHATPTTDHLLRVDR